MSTKLIELENGVFVEVDGSETDVQQISGGVADKVDSSIDRIKPLLLKICNPIVDAWKELNKEMIIAKAEVEIGLSFEGEGNIYVTKVKAGANYLVKLTLEPPKDSGN